MQAKILAPKEHAHARKIRLRWLIAVSSLPFLGILTAFGIAPDTDTAHIAVQTIVENLPLSSSLSVEDNQSNTVSFWRDEQVERGDTAAAILQRMGVNNSQIALFLKNAPATKALIAVKPGKRIQAQVTGLGDLIWLRHFSNDGKMLQIDHQNNQFLVSKQAIKLDVHTVMKSGIIQNTLFNATDAADIPDAIATQLADIFSTNIDFHQDLQQGDHFNLIYEMLEHDGEPIMTGRILAAEFINSGHTYRAILSDVGGKSAYYTPDGKPLKNAFLRSPVAFSRISSGFAMRFHPILKKWKQHKGVDYAAPIGTKVMAIADATVDFVGQQTGYGNLIVLKHAGIYSTAYGHLSAFAKGLHRGEKVAQGDVIGYVGMSGWATGPHLHYEFRVAGVPTNPLTAKMPSALPVTASLMPMFKTKTQNLIGQLELLDGVQQVAME
jgi:murein DD-endopeptidase MepM/ murein hydrolase activator NlpD